MNDSSSLLANEMKPRILLVSHANFLGGAERVALEIARTLDPARFSVTMACAPGALMEAARAAGVSTAPLALPQVRGVRNLPGAPLKLWAGVRDLRRLIRQARAQIVHSHSMRASLYAAPAARLSGAKFVWHVHDLHRERAYVYLMSALAHAIIASSRAIAQTIPTFARRKTRVVYNGVQLSDFAQADGEAWRAAHGIAPEQLLVGNVGWLAPWKGTHEFIACAALIAAHCPTARFVIVGAASDARYHAYERELRAQGERLLGDKLLWAGAQQPVQPALAALDVMLHCAVREPFGRVLIEAMALRVPVIAFAGGGPDEIIAHGETGWLCAPHDVHEMAERARTLLADAALREALGTAARERVAREFDARRVIQQIADVYDALLGKAA